jgi:outer membrane protein assembly factor BamB
MNGALAVLLLAAVWPMYQFFPHHNAVFAGNDAVSWRRDFGAKINGGLALVGDTIYGDSFDGRVWAVNARTGALRWSAQTGGVVMTTPVVAGNTVIVGTGTSRVLVQTANRLIWGRPQGDAIVAFDARSGRVRWRYATAGEDMPSPALARVRGDDAVIFANGDDRVRALRVRDGRLLWQRTVNGIASMSSAANDRGAIFVVVGGAPNSKISDSLLALDAQTGRLLWSAPYGNADCSPAVAYRRVFVQGSASDASRPAGHDAFNIVYAVDEGTGKLRWRWYSGYGTFTGVGSDEQGVAGLAADDALYQAIPVSDVFAAFDAASGRVRWSIHTEAAVKMSAVEKDGILYFGDTGNTWYMVEARTGRMLLRRRFPSYFTVSSPVIRGRTLYVANTTVLYALPLGTK